MVSPDTRFADVPLARRRDRAEETAVVAAASAAGLFRALTDRPSDAAGVASELDLDPRAVGIVLSLLVDLDLLERRNGTFHPTEHAWRTLGDPSAETWEGGGLPHWLSLLRSFTRLQESLASGGPLEETPEPAGGESETDRIRRFMAAMAAAPRERVRRLVDLCLDRTEEPGRALDLGGGPGHMSKELARRGLEVVLFDRPETVSFVTGEYGLDDEEAIHPVGGDFVEDALPEGPFDLVLLSNVLHIYGPRTNREILRKVAGVTAEGGICAISEFVRGVSPRASRFALVMLLKTEAGNTYTEREFAGWLEEAGFVEPRLDELDDERQLITAVRG